jgi:MazG family protein
MESKSSIGRLAEIVERLRAPDGCPWDREQTLESVKSGVIEEAYEVLDAIDSGDRSALKEELGDLLLQVVFQSRICEEEGAFTLDDVAETVSEKLVRRHPHVFGEVEVSGTDEVLRNWDAIKKAEKKDEQGAPASVVEGIPNHLPALLKAYQVQKRAARAGFDWEKTADVLDKLQEEVDELREAVEHGDDAHIQEELGDLLFSVVNLSRHLGHDPEELLRRNIRKFIRRFQQVEQAVHASGRPFEDFSLEELDGFWAAVKEKESSRC